MRRLRVGAIRCRWTFYRPFELIDRKETTRFIAGLVQEEQDESEQLLALKQLEALLGTVDVAAYCGLGRRSPRAAELAAKRTRLLLSA
jgi:hypothetical protein